VYLRMKDGRSGFYFFLWNNLNELVHGR
jgi:hypothetical protein